MHHLNMHRCHTSISAGAVVSNCLKLVKRNTAKIVVISSRFLAQSNQFAAHFINALANDCQVQSFIVSGEPSPELVDDIVKQCDADTDAVIAIGGGSVLDAAKAVAGLIPSQTSVMDYLEGSWCG